MDDAEFWNRIAERYTPQPVANPLSRRGLVKDIRQSGFIDIPQPDVGAGRTLGFVVAIKPGSHRDHATSRLDA